MDLSLIFKVLGEETRLRMLGLLFDRELCVCDIESVLGISQANASRHLAKMKSAGILSSRKSAQWVYYDIDKLFSDAHSDLMEALRVEVKKLPDYKIDIKNLKAAKKNTAQDQC